jgi:hypothetical protein
VVVRLETKVHKVHREVRVFKEIRASLVFRDTLESKDLPAVLLALRVFRVPRVSKVCRASLALMVFKGLREKLALKVYRVLQVELEFKVRQACKEQPVRLLLMLLNLSSLAM